MSLCLIEMLVGQGRLCQNEIVFLSFGYGDGTLVGAAELIVFGIEEVEPGKRLEPVAPDGFLCTVEDTVFAVELHLPAEVARTSQSLVCMVCSHFAVARPIGGTGVKRVDEGTVLIGLGQWQCLVEHLHGFLHLVFPFHRHTAVLRGQCKEEISSQQEGISLDAEQVETVGCCGGRVSLRHGCQAIVSHLPQGAHMPLQGGDISIIVEQLRNVKHLARPGIVVEIIVGEDLHQLHEIRHMECELLLRTIHPGFHRVVGMEECRLIDIRVDDLVGRHQVAASQQQCCHHHGEISHFHFLSTF